MKEVIENVTGVCPLPKGTMVQVQYRDGSISGVVPALVSHWDIPDYDGEGSAEDWSLDDVGADIIGYRLVETKND